MFLFHHQNFCQCWRKKPLFVPFSSSELLSKLEKETFVCYFFIIRTFVRMGEGDVCLFLFHHQNFCQNRRRKPLFVPFPSSKLLSKSEEEMFVCFFSIIKTFVKIGEGNKRGEGDKIRGEFLFSNSIYIRNKQKFMATQWLL